jgi:hypothetical protein
MHTTNGVVKIQPHLAEEMERSIDGLRDLAERLKQRERELDEREAALAEMIESYPHYRAFVYARLKEEALARYPISDERDLATIAREEGTLDLEGFLEQLEQPLVQSTR